MKFFLTLVGLLTTQLIAAQTLLDNMPTASLSSVHAFEKVGDLMYIGGSFSQLDDQPRTNIARFNVTTGELDSWAPNVTGGNVYSIFEVAGKIVLGGSFNSVNGQERLGVCVFDHATGDLDPWSGAAFYFSWGQGIGIDGNNFYYHGFNPYRILSADASTGTSNSWATSPLFTQQQDVNAILVVDDYVYVGGDFTFETGSSVYDNLCRFHLSTGDLDSTWHPEPAIWNFGVTNIVRTNDLIFVGGDFNEISGESRSGVAAFDLDGNLAPFNQNSSASEVFALFPDGDKIWVGGNSWMLGGQPRWRIAQIDIASSAATCWNASSVSEDWSIVQAIYVAGDTVYTGPYGNPGHSVFVGGPLPLTPATISGPDGVLPNADATYSIPEQPGYTYSWEITGGTGTSTTNSIDVTWGPGPIGTVEVIVDNPGQSNCSSNPVVLEVTISESVSISELDDEDSAFSLFPNPTTGSVTLHYHRAAPGESTQVQVVDAVGRVVLHTNIQGTMGQLDISALTSGMYSVVITKERGNEIKRLIKH